MKMKKERIQNVYRAVSNEQSAMSTEQGATRRMVDTDDARSTVSELEGGMVVEAPAKPCVRCAPAVKRIERQI